MDSLSEKSASLPNADVVGRALANQLGRLPAHIERADIESAAWLAYHKFMDGDGAALEGVPLAQRLYVVVRCAIADRMREADPLGRYTRRLVKRLAAAKTELVAALGREPSDEEVARAAGVTITAAREALAAADAQASEAGVHANVSAYDDWIAPPDRAADVENEINALDVSEALNAELNKLSSAAQHVIRRVLMEGSPVAEVADEMRSTPYKVCQMRDAALKKLRASPVIQELLPA